MNFVFGYAGIPFEVFDDIKKLEKNLASGVNTDTEVFFAPPLTKSKPVLSPFHIKSLQKKFKERTLEERDAINKGAGDHISNIGFAVIYVRTDQKNDDAFEDAFFPSTLVFPVDWKLTGYNKQKINESKTELFKQLLKVTIFARVAIEALHKEITECRNRTPLLLPIKNFHSKILRSRLQELQVDLAEQPDKVAIAAAVKKTINLIKTDHPLKKVEDSRKKQPCFLDDRGIEFHSPGSAQHGLPSPTENHPVACLLGGYRRLGAPFHAAFHYDCMKGARGNLKGSFHSCHDEANIIEGKPHLNIAPNDFVRP